MRTSCSYWTTSQDRKKAKWLSGLRNTRISLWMTDVPAWKRTSKSALDEIIIVTEFTCSQSHLNDIIASSRGYDWKKKVVSWLTDCPWESKRPHQACKSSNSCPVASGKKELNTFFWSWWWKYKSELFK